MAAEDGAAEDGAAKDVSSAPESPAGERASPAGDAERHARISEAAYYSAERRGFQGERALDDWLEAEREIDSRRGGKGVAMQASLRQDDPGEAVGAVAGQTVPDSAELIAPDRIGSWARKLKVPAPRLREAIGRVGPVVSDVKQYLETANP